MLRQLKAAGRWLVTLPGAGWSLTALLLAVSVVGLPNVVPGVGLDASWHEVLNYAFTQGWSAGRDYVFTHGPLGPLQTTTYHPGTFTLRLLWGPIYAVFTAVVFCLAASRLPGLLPRVLFLVLLLALPVHWSAHVVILATTLVILHAGKSTRWLAALSMGVFAVLSLVKFTFLIAAAVAAPVILGHVWRRHGWRSAAGVAGFGLAALLGAAAAAGQSISALPAYLAYGVELTLGYNQAMARTDGAASEIAMALVALGAIALTLLLSVSRRPVPRHVLLSSAVVAVFVFVAWKHAFVRHGLHSLGFFAMAAVLPFLVWPWVTADGRRRRAVQRACLVAVLGVGVAGVQLVMSSDRVELPWTRWIAHARDRIAHRATALTDVRGYQDRLAQARAELAARHSLPEVVRTVGSGRIDMIGYSQRVLLLDELNWAPRPVFQSYSAYTPILARLNRDYYASGRAPEFVLLDGRTIDDRLPTLDDGPALLEILRRYQPLRIERRLALLRRRSRPLPSSPARPLSESRARFGEWIEIAALGAEPKAVTLDISMTARGKVRGLFYKPPEARLEVDFVDAGSTTYRLIPSMTRDPVLIDPLPRTLGEWWRVLHGDGASRVRRVRATTDPRNLSSFAQYIHVRILPATLP